MSFGRPPTFGNIAATPPDRGSFPLDHEGECQALMKSYLRCLKANASDNGRCRPQSKDYLECRMSRGLMERDEWKNLGFDGVSSGESQTPKDSGQTAKR